MGMEWAGMRCEEGKGHGSEEESALLGSLDFTPMLFNLHTDFSGGRGKVIWYSHLLKNFPEFVVVYTVKGFSIVNKADVFLEFSCFFDDPVDVGNFISGSSAFSKLSLNIWNSRFTYS